MAEIKVERTDDEHRERRGFPKWLLAIPVLGLLLVPFLNRDDDRRDAAIQDRPAQVVAYQGRDWRPEGAPVTLNDTRMVVAGRTADGRNLYSERLAGGGGGLAERSGRMYLRLADGRYQPLVAR